MMKAIIKCSDDLTIEVEGDKEPLLFDNIARVQQIFAVPCCGKCRSKNFKFVSRLAGKKAKYIELVCSNSKCRAKLQYSQSDKGEIYPKLTWDSLSEKQKEFRKDEKEHADQHGGYLPNNGWFVYKRGEGYEE